MSTKTQEENIMSGLRKHWTLPFLKKGPFREDNSHGKVFWLSADVSAKALPSMLTWLNEERGKSVLLYKIISFTKNYSTIR